MERKCKKWSRKPYLYGSHGFEQCKELILNKLANIEFWFCISKEAYSGLRQLRTLCSLDEPACDVCGNYTFAVDLRSCRRLIIIAH